MTEYEEFWTFHFQLLLHNEENGEDFEILCYSASLLHLIQSFSPGLMRWFDVQIYPDKPGKEVERKMNENKQDWLMLTITELAYSHCSF